MKAKIRFIIKNNKMSASLLIGRPSEEYVVTLEEIEKAMAEEGIVYGILKDKLEAAVETQSFLSEIPCAEGLEPIPGKSGEIKFVVNTDTELKPRIRDDGTADYHDLGLITEVDEGRLLCRRTRPIPGVDGCNIYGEVIPFKKGEYPDFPAGEGTKISPIDDTKLVASRNGYIKFDLNKINVFDVFKLRGDVDNGTGNIVFRGDIIINGCVREGFLVKSNGNITINGAAEGATIEALGNIKIRDGYTGMETGQITAAGNIESKYIQNAIVKCGGDLTTTYMLNSFVSVGGETKVDSGKGAVAGGMLHSVGSVTAKYLGNDTYIATKIIVDDLPEGFWDPHFIPTSKNTEEGVASEIGEDEDVDEIPMIHSPKDAKIMVRDCVYPEVRIQMGMSFVTVDREIRCTKFELLNCEISETPLL